KLAVAVGDVAGKGVPAALMMAKLSSDAQLSLLTIDEAGRAIAHLNNMLYPHTSPLDRFVTLVACILDTNTHTVTMVSGGHQAPLLTGPGKEATDAFPNDVAGLPLGMLDDMEFDTCTITLRPGESLVVFTDGVPDAQNTRDEPFGNKKLHEAV